MLLEAAPTFGWLKTALNNLALAAMNDTTILQQLTAANLALTTMVAMLTATNKKLVDAAAMAKGGGTLSVTPKNPSRGVRGTLTPFPGNYCWTHRHCCNEHHTSATCSNKAVGHRDDATASNTIGGSTRDKGWDTAGTLWGGMANLVYCDDNQLLKNNYYFALSTTPACNPTQLPSSHTGIANSGASGFYFAPGAPVSNFNPQAPVIGVWIANGLPEQSVVSATLASAHRFPLQQCKAM